MIEERMSAPDMLESAADLIENVGHTRRSYKSFDKEMRVTGYCITGAIYESVPIALRGNTLFETREAIAAVRMEILRRFPHRYDGDIAVWNDFHASDGAEVVDVLRHAAKNLRNETGEQK
jgi:hypothetical protein